MSYLLIGAQADSPLQRAWIACASIGRCRRMAATVFGARSSSQRATKRSGPTIISSRATATSSCCSGCHRCSVRRAAFANAGRSVYRTDQPMAQTPTISTHVLDTGLGRPARGVPVTLYRMNGASPARIAQAVTDDDGRVRDLLGGALEAGAYRIEFDLSGYARAQGKDGGFFARFASDFEVKDIGRSYHVPLILSPHSGITYLGS